jgi:hypothetical protein
VLGIDERAVSGDVEDAAAAFDELSLESQLLGDLGRQTGGLGQVTSAHAILDGDAHCHGSAKVTMIADTSVRHEIATPAGSR